MLNPFLFRTEAQTREDIVNSIPEWKDIEGLAKWVIRKALPKKDYRENLGLAYLMYDRCKETYDPTKGNFESYYRLRLYGEIHRAIHRHGSVIYKVKDSDIESLNVEIHHKEDRVQTGITEALDVIEDTRCFVATYDDLVQDVINKLDKLQGIDPVRLSAIKYALLSDKRIKNSHDDTYDAAIEIISTYLN